MPISNPLRYDLNQIVGEAGVLPDDHLNRYQMDGFVPQAVVAPSSTHEIQDVLYYAAEQELSVIPAGNGTKLGIGNLPKKVDLVLSTSRLNQVLEYEPADLTLIVQSGMRLAALQAKLAEHRQYLPLDPPYGDQATIGGITATNSSGSSRLRYGSTRDFVLGMHAVQSSGVVVKSGGRTVKNVAGYDLNKLYIGSFGTLGIITEVAFKLQPLPEIERTVLLTCKEIGQVVNTALEIASSQLLPIFLNLFVNGVPFTEIAEPCLLIGLDGQPETVEWQIDQVGLAAKQNGAIGVGVYEATSQRDIRMSMRSFPEGGWASPIVMSKASLRVTDIEGFIHAALATGNDLRCLAQVMGLMGNGIVYVALSGFPNGDIPAESVAGALAKLREAATNVGGNFIVESAPVEVKRQIDVWGPVGRSFDLMKQIKAKLDPIGLLNPGRFVGGI
ncbi:MAG: FAD-binding oxidoreductase [Candidatus Poribacteria bacterium]|nr:FAD-binding oxidoreductase [Candidatus Poribacteria bacterium]